MKSYAERPVHEMTNARADRVKNVARLTGRSARLKTGTFRVEGPQGVREALADPKAKYGTLRELYYQPETLERHPDIADLISGLDQSQVFVRSTSAEVIAAMCDVQTPQGLVAVCTLVGNTEQPQPRGHYAALLCGVQDPGNAGTIIRVADAAGAGAVVFSQSSVDLHNPKVVRSTAGSLFHLPLYQGQAIEATVGTFRDAGWQILAADGYGATNLDELQNKLLANQADDGPGPDLRRDTLWLFGNEAQGLSEAELALSDARVAVPLYGKAESLNVATAATLCIYASARVHRFTNEQKMAES